MDKKNIIIFGSGVSGLVCAYYLALTNKFNIYVYEKNNIVGGMARSTRFETVPAEVSWRAYGIFYDNLFELMNDINVFDNLNKNGVGFTLFRTNDIHPNTISLIDYPILAYYLLIHILSDERKNNHYDIKLNELLKNKVSKNTYEYLVKHLCGPGMGMDQHTASYGHFAHVAQVQLFSRGITWNLANKPTNEAWINQLYNKLQNMGVKFNFNKSLSKIYYDNNNIKYCVLESGEKLIADEYVVAINPFMFETILYNSGLIDMSLQYKKINNQNNQISFRIGFNKKIFFPKNNPSFVLLDSKNNITFSAHDHVFTKDVYLGKNLKSLWSGTCVDSYDLMKNKDLKQIKEEIIKQMFESNTFIEYVKKYNPTLKTFSPNDIDHFEIFEDWYYDYDKKELQTKYKKWVNDAFNEHDRPEQSTKFTNMFVCGAHTKTSLNIWSMEAATESGKTVNNLIRKKYNLPITHIYLHNKTTNIITLIGKIDNIFYRLNLPHIIIFIIIIVIIAIILKIKKNKFT